ncbi:MAG: hypothetical protein IH588_09660 [Anaerolineales bacterium]|nr:hypothetical protein [Anaerolineales bacterium]
MKPRLFFWTVSLIIALAASACASAQSISTPIAEAPPVVEAMPATTAPEATAPAATAASSVDVQAVATSRGPNLEATDPTTVSLASGQLQLVEFFRFT